MNTNCRTCGTTLQSQISRDYGLCGACRHAWEHRDEQAPAAPPPPPAPSPAIQKP